jgi:hypothetical protein
MIKSINSSLKRKLGNMKKNVSFSNSPLKMKEASSTETFDELKYYRELLFRYGDELREVFKGFDSIINKKTLSKDIRNTKGNKHHYLIRNLRYIIKKDMFTKHNTDLD